jgi:hypothetical protein
MISAEIRIQDRTGGTSSVDSIIAVGSADVVPVKRIFIEHFPSGGFVTTSMPLSGLSSLNIPPPSL